MLAACTPCPGAQKRYSDAMVRNHFPASGIGRNIPSFLARPDGHFEI